MQGTTDADCLSADEKASYLEYIRGMDTAALARELRCAEWLAGFRPWPQNHWRLARVREEGERRASGHSFQPPQDRTQNPYRRVYALFTSSKEAPCLASMSMTTPSSAASITAG